MDINMFNWSIYVFSAYAIFVFAFAGWILSLMTSKVSHVDSMWSLFFLISAFSITLFDYQFSTRAFMVIALIAIWAIRLSAHITLRNWGHEDHRYIKIKENNEPFFWLKSIYIVFGLQAFLAWIISISIFGAINSNLPINNLDYIGVLIVLFGLYWEVVADRQLNHFKNKPENSGKVLNTGLWAYSRHPNYFGECCIWWGLYAIALAAGAWWAIISPVLMTLLLLKVSGVSLLESTIVERRPAYQDYIENTNAFIPWFTKNAKN
jgi:steroid 5-alpha reductase family enzyme